MTKIIAINNGEAQVIVRWESDDYTPEVLCRMFHCALIGLGYMPETASDWMFEISKENGAGK